MRVLSLSFTLCLATATAAWSEATTIDLSGRQVVYHSDVKLTSSQKRDLRNARKADFFGAVAVNTVNRTYDASGAAWGYHDLASAQGVALRSCQFKAERPEDCVLYLSVLPRGFDTISKGNTLSKTGVDAYNYVVKWSRVNFDKYRSFATNGIHTWSYSASATSRQAAEKEALKICEDTFAASQKKKDPAWAEAVYSKDQRNCSIFATFVPN